MREHHSFCERAVPSWNVKSNWIRELLTFTLEVHAPFFLRRQNPKRRETLLMLSLWYEAEWHPELFPNIWKTFFQWKPGLRRHTSTIPSTNRYKCNRARMQKPKMGRCSFFNHVAMPAVRNLRIAIRKWWSKFRKPFPTRNRPMVSVGHPTQWNMERLSQNCETETHKWSHCKTALSQFCMLGNTCQWHTHMRCHLWWDSFFLFEYPHF